LRRVTSKGTKLAVDYPAGKRNRDVQALNNCYA